MSSNTYKCEKCGNTLLKSNKILHDLKCTSINECLNFAPNYNNINNNFYDINEFGAYYCNKCGANIKLKDRTDHLLCHQIEEENKANNNDGDDSMISNSHSSNDGEMQSNYVNNININIINNINGRTYHKNYRIGGNMNNSYSEEYNEDNDNENNNENVNEEIEDNEEQDEDGSYDDEYYSDEENGIDENIIKTFQVSKIKDISKLDEDKKKCCICLENFIINDETMILPCIHIFHSNCIKKWLKRQNICPICKNKII